MKVPFADLPGFKKVDARLRDIASASIAAINEVDGSLAGRRTEAERDTLLAVRAMCEVAAAQAKAIRAKLWDGVAKL